MCAAGIRPSHAETEKIMTPAWIRSLFGFYAHQPASAKRRHVRPIIEELEGRLTPAPLAWVSGVGDDANDGSRTAPDKTFAGALNDTDAGGVIQALDPGGFGAVLIDKSITIDGTGTMAGVLVTSGSGITISAGSTDVIVLRHLILQGLGDASHGIRILSAGEVHIEDCVIRNFAGEGIDFEPTNAGARLFVSNTTVLDNIEGVLVAPSNVAATATLDHVQALANGVGVQVEDGALVSIADSVAAGNSGVGFQTITASTPARVDLVNVVASNNGASGVSTEGAESSVTYSGLTAVGNSGAATAPSAGGTITAFGSNMLADNGLGFTPIAIHDNTGVGAAQRTWVSGVGDDFNPGSRTAPNQTFLSAISRTASGGETDALDPGNFGPVTITKSFTIEGAAALAAITAGVGFDGITIDTVQDSDVVILRNLTLDGSSLTALNGIKIVHAGAVIIEDCIIKNFGGAGIDFEPTTDGTQLFVVNCMLVDNASGGVLVKPAAGMTARASLDGVHAYANQFGVRVEDGGDVAVTNSVVSSNVEDGFQAASTIAAATINLQGDVASNNGMNGATATGANAVINFAEFTATGNSGPATANVAGAMVNASGANHFADNGKLFTLSALAPGSGGGTQQRAWVSGVGADVNPASRTAPVLTIANALTKVNAGGEINSLDSGDFGSFTIDKSVTIDGGINMTAAESITISAGASDVIILRHLRLNGFGSGAGVHIMRAGAVIIEDCVIENFGNQGIDFEPTNDNALLFVHDVSLLHNTNGGVYLSGIGPSQRAMASLDHVTAYANLYGVLVDPGTDVTVSHSAASGNTLEGYYVFSTIVPAHLNLESVLASNNGRDGLTSEGAGATLAMSNVTDTGNAGQGVLSRSGGSVVPFGSNRFADNVKGFTPIPLTAGPGAPARAWVSGLGNDADAGDRANPDLTYAGAYADVVAGGEIDTTLAGEFGPLTITHSMTIDGTGRAAIIRGDLVDAGITIDAGPNDVVILRGLTITGHWFSAGIRIIQAGAVIIEDCLLANTSTYPGGILFQPVNVGAQLFVSNTRLFHTYGVTIQPNGVAARATIDHVQAQGGRFGVSVADGASATVANSHFSGGASWSVLVQATNASSVATLEGVVVANNSFGVRVETGVLGTPGTATIYLSNAAATGNESVAFSGGTSQDNGRIISFSHHAADNNGGLGVLAGTLDTTSVLPTVGSLAVTNLQANTATLGATVGSDGGADILTRGIVFSRTSVNADPTLGGTGVTNLPSLAMTGAFTVNAGGLTPNVQYSFTAYASNRVGLIYAAPPQIFTPILPAASNHHLFVDSQGLSEFTFGEEKWLRGDVNQFGNPWYFITPAGDVMAWDGGADTGALVVHFNSSAWENPELVVNAFATQPVNPAELAPADQMRGFYRSSTGNYSKNSLGSGEKWLKGLSSAKSVTNQNNPWYYILPNGSVFEWAGGTSLKGTKVNSITADVNLYDDPSQLWNAFQDTSVHSGGFANLRHFFFDRTGAARNLYENATGTDEKWIRGDTNQFGNPWYIVRPNGDLVEWDGSSFGGGNILAHLGANAWNDIERVVADFTPSLTPAQQQKLVDLDQQYSLFRISADMDFLHGMFNVGAKWLFGSQNQFGNHLYFLEAANGILAAWNGIPGDGGRLLAFGLPADVFAEPLLLANAYADGSVLDNPIPLDPFGPNTGGPGDKLA